MAEGLPEIHDDHQICKPAPANLLLAEDNVINQKFAAGLLKMLGVQVDVVSNGKAAVQKLQESKESDKLTYDAVLMDLEMPVMDGFTATRIIRRDTFFKTLPIIAMTAHAQRYAQEKCLDAGMNDIVIKPIDAQQLSQALAKHIKDCSCQKLQEHFIQDPISVGDSWEDMPANIAGIDVDSALNRIGGRTGLLKELLGCFLVEFGDAEEKLKEYFEKEDIEQAGRLVHSIKGGSGNIGADALFAAATDLEPYLASKSGKAMGPALALFFKRHQRVVNSLKGLNLPSPCKTIQFIPLKEGQDSAPASETILVVDDNPDSIRPLIENLACEYEILVVTQAEKALEIALSSKRPDVILLDVMMPGMDGYELFSRLKSEVETRDIPVIFITARSEFRDEVKGLEIGAQDYITKPFSLPVVRARIKTVLNLKKELNRRVSLKSRLEEMNRRLENQVRTKMMELKETREALRAYEEKYNNLLNAARSGPNSREDETDSRVTLTQKLEDLNKNLEIRVKQKTIALKQAHEDLRASEKRYRTIYETAIEGIFEITPQGRFLSASPSLARMLGYESPLELISTINDAGRQHFIAAEDRTRLRTLLEEKGQFTNYKTRLRRKQNDTIEVMISAKAVHNEISGRSHYQGFVINLTANEKKTVKNRA